MHPNLAPTSLPRLVLAAPGTGQGKTTVAAALISLLREGHLRVAPFKVGPDYIDPTHHAAAAGRASRNLDGWLHSPETLVSLFRRATTRERSADIAVIEGMMGLFDGRAALDDAGSTAAVAGLLRAPVVLVLDVWTMGRGAAAIVHGVHTFAEETRLAGVILNRAAGPGHFALCHDAIERYTGVPVLGYLAADAEIAIPERHLGLVLSGEHGMRLDRLVDSARSTLDVEAILRIAHTADPLPSLNDPLPPPVASTRARIAVARDSAFGFYYEDNLDLLRDLGVELRFFSPLDDTALPGNADALYIGGGYPELHAAQLSANREMLRAVRRFADGGRPVYAECGGLMYLSEALLDTDGVRYEMVGAIPGVSRMHGLTIGYREVHALSDSPLACAGWTVRGHEFHHSVLEPAPVRPAYRRSDGSETEGIVAGPADNVLASYIHLHFATDPRLAQRLVEQATCTYTASTR